MDHFSNAGSPYEFPATCEQPSSNFGAHYGFSGIAWRPSRRIFHVLANVTLNLENLHLSGGYSGLAHSSVIPKLGCVVANYGTVNMRNCRIDTNLAYGAHGVIYNLGMLTIRDSEFSNNYVRDNSGNAIIYNAQPGVLLMENVLVDHTIIRTMCSRQNTRMAVIRNNYGAQATLQNCNFTRTHDARCPGRSWNLDTYVILNDGSMRLMHSMISGSTSSHSSWSFYNQDSRRFYNLFNSATGELTYILPAPLGHYVDNVFQCRPVMCIVNDQLVFCANQLCDHTNYEWRDMAVIPQNTRVRQEEYPRLCAAGTVGNSSMSGSQLSQHCAGPCPAGYYCGRGTITPVTCPPGTTSPPGAVREDECLMCPPGSIMPTPGLARCVQCAAGTFQDKVGSTSCKSCTIGRYCVEGTSAPLPCVEGSYSNATNLSSAAQCTSASAGFYTPTGSTEQIECAAGTIAAVGGLGACTPCLAGSYQQLRGQTACVDCTPGRFCVEGASAPIPCPGGTHMNSSLLTMTSDTDCVVCDVGTFCPVGSEAPADCAPGTYNDQLTASNCRSCPGGTYQKLAGQTACSSCDTGHYCAEGAAAPLPCPAGTRQDLSLPVMTSMDDCAPCSPGTSCSVGSHVETLCLSGSVAPNASMDSCTLCPSGKFQREYGQLECEICERGRYCRVGTSEPVPCPAGYFGSAFGLYSAGQCSPAPVNFWAPLGSIQPERCPQSGFYCPGTLQDPVHGGAKPVLMPVGQSTQQNEVPALTKSMRLDMSIDDFAQQREALKVALAQQYGVNASLITLVAIASSRRARMVRALQSSSSSVELRVTIATTDGSGNNVDFATLEASVAAVDDTALAITVGDVTGTTITVVSEPAMAGTVRVTVEFACPKGKWCTAGLVVNCSLGTYNPLRNQDFATACVMCPLNSSTIGEGSEARAKCICNEGYYNANASFAIDQDLIAAMERAGKTPVSMKAAVIDCQTCPVGTDCGRGSTLERLPLQRGYYRTLSTSNDVRRCSDATVGCGGTGEAACTQSNSACFGGDDNTLACMPGLTGPFCELCDSSGTGALHFQYYQKATSVANATCVGCDDNALLPRMARLYAMGVGIVLGIVATIALAPHYLPSTVMKRIARLWLASKPNNKIKIVTGFCTGSLRLRTALSAISFRFAHPVLPAPPSSRYDCDQG